MTVSQIADDTRAVPPSPVPSGPRRGLYALAAVAAGWLGSWVCYVAGVAIVLPVLVVLATAALLRAGRSLLDRLVLAGVLLFGALCAGGLVFSVWPWGLNPVMLAGTAFTGLVAISLWTGRTPRLPHPLGSLADVWTLCAGAATAVLVAFPLLHAHSWRSRFSLFVVQEDLSRHFAVFDTIRAVGGYTFLHAGGTTTALRDNLVAYPQGSHLGMAVIDNFVMSSTTAGATHAELDRFLAYYVLTFAFLVLVVVWAMRWIAGGALSAWRFLPLAALAAAYLFFGDGTAMFVRGFPSEFAGLTLMAALMAVTVRPLRGIREQLLTVSALLVGISFSYYLLLPVAGAMTVVWIWNARTKLRAAWAWTALTTLATVVLVAVPPLENWRYANSSTQLNSGGGISPVNRHLLILLVLLVVAGLLPRLGRRSPVRRMTAVWLGVAVLSAGAFGLYQRATSGSTSYYFEKQLHVVFVVALVALGGTRLPVRPWAERARGPLGRLRFVRALPVPAVAIVLSAALVLALAVDGGPDRKVWRKPPHGLSWGAGWLDDKLTQPNSAAVVDAALRAYPKEPDGRADLFQVRGDWQANYYGSLWVGALTRTYGTSWAVWTTLGTEESARLVRAKALRILPLKLRVWTNDPALAADLQAFRQQRPDVGLEVMYSSPLRCTYDFAPLPQPAPGQAVVLPAPGPAERGCHAKG